VSESSHPPTWPGQCTLESRSPASIKVASPQVDPKFLDRDRPQVYIIDSGRKPAELSHINARGRKLTPKKPKRAQARRRTQGRAGGRKRRGCGVGGRKAQILLYTERGRGGARFPPPIYTQYLHFYNRY